MKKYLLSVLFALSLASVLTAESIRIKVEGPEDSYNQIRIINNTKYSDFDVKVYLLKEKDEKFIIKDTLGVFHLKGFFDTDSNKVDVSRKSYIGLSLPEELGDISYSVTYKDLPFFDAIEIFLFDGVIDKYGEDPQGKEFI
ncbi:MAG: hypothetical protein J5780_03910 [Treponema sp.]|nr:hypothetical protein [Treponema sp.]